MKDVADAAAWCEPRLVIVGHSFGALIMLRYLKRHDAAGAAPRDLAKKIGADPVVALLRKAR